MKLKVKPPYKPLVQLPFCCEPCSLLWVLHRRGYWINQEEIAKACNLYIPKKLTKLFTEKMKIAKTKKYAGTSPKTFYIYANKLLNKKKIPLKIEKHFISQIDEPKKFLIDHMKKGHDIMVDFACKPFPPLGKYFSGGHVCVVAEFDTNKNIVTLGDPSWVCAKYWKVSLKKIIRAMDKKYDGYERGFLVIRKR